MSAIETGAADGRPEVVRTVAELRARVGHWRRSGERVAMVPTMGALHDGHLSLVRIGYERADRVVVSIFVNPTQFGPNEDFKTYPRSEARDLELLELLGTDLVFAPLVGEMYPPDFSTKVVTGGAAVGLETDFRPHFFEGVATVVTKLLNACGPDVAVFGEKDYQQLCVVRQIVRDLGMPVEIVGAPTVREKDGLAMSSRNAYLDPRERSRAPVLHQVLRDVAESARTGGPVERAIDRAQTRLGAVGFGKIDYIEVRDAATLGPPGNGPQRVLAAAWLGRTRLIDNCAV
ncbi:pantoate--beta-alanine ligase [Prosthecomicrobium sp. N25]|uniref:pantoate--beta-alanine ligase n=1 Tax=Prosthecomicrobium sp. N25 TaxID=3129254 RepID=UPI0030773125